MLDVLISGKLVRDPVTRTGKSGHPFTTALVRVPVDKEEAVLANVIAFGEAGERLGRLKAGDSVSLCGTAKLSEWEKDGEAKHGLSVTASAILTAYDVQKRRGGTDGAARAASPATAKGGGYSGQSGAGQRTPPPDESPGFDDWGEAPPF